MTEQQPRPDDRAQDRPDEQDPEGRRPGDLGGPAAVLGSGVEEALVGDQPTEEDEGGAGASPQPKG